MRGSKEVLSEHWKRELWRLITNLLMFATCPTLLFRNLHSTPVCHLKSNSCAWLRHVQFPQCLVHSGNFSSPTLHASDVPQTDKN